MFHSLICTGSPRTPSTLKSSEYGIFFFVANFYHPESRLSLYLAVNGATYEM